MFVSPSVLLWKVKHRLMSFPAVGNLQTFINIPVEFYACPCFWTIAIKHLTPDPVLVPAPLMLLRSPAEVNMQLLWTTSLNLCVWEEKDALESSTTGCEVQERGERFQAFLRILMETSDSEEKRLKTFSQSSPKQLFQSGPVRFRMCQAIQIFFHSKLDHHVRPWRMQAVERLKSFEELQQ